MHLLSGAPGCPPGLTICTTAQGRRQLQLCTEPGGAHTIWQGPRGGVHALLESGALGPHRVSASLAIVHCAHVGMDMDSGRGPGSGKGSRMVTAAPTPSRPIQNQGWASAAPTPNPSLEVQILPPHHLGCPWMRGGTDVGAHGHGASRGPAAVGPSSWACPWVSAPSLTPS